jgi:hypothetical protein
VGEFVRQELECDMATELEVFHLINNTHPPTANIAKDAVMGNRLPTGWEGVVICGKGRSYREERSILRQVTARIASGDQLSLAVAAE